MPGAQVSQVLQVAIARQDAVGVADDRFDDDAGDVAAHFVEQLCRRVEVVIGKGEREVGQRLGHAGRIGQSERERARAGLHQEAVAVAVVAALELHQAGAAGGAARQADRRQRGFGTRIDHAHHLHGRHQATHGFGHRDFQRVGHAEAQAVAHGARHGVQHGRVRVACDHRAPAADVVDVAVAVHVDQVGALGALGEERLPTHRLERAHR